MRTEFDFIRDEGLYTSGPFSYNGYSYIKYVDFIIYENGEFCHFILIKDNVNFIFKEYKTMKDIPFAFAKKVLKLAQKVDYSSYSILAKPDVNCFERLYELINTKDTHYQEENIILDLSDNQPNKKSIEFSINNNVPITQMDVVITNLQTSITANVTKSSYAQIRNLDKIFCIQANSKAAFINLLCEEAIFLNSNFVSLMFSTEQEVYLKSTIMQKTILGGETFWAFEIVKHLTNLDRDIPIEMSISSLKPQNCRLFFVFAIYGLSIKYDLHFGLVTFTNDSGMDSDRTNKFLDLTALKPDCYAQVTIFGSNISDAIISAKKSIRKAIELLQIVMLDDSTTFFFETQRDNAVNWNKSQLTTRLNIADYFYVEDVENNINYAIVPGKQTKTKTAVLMPDTLFELLNDENVIEEFFYLENKKNDDLLQSIYLLNQSYKEKDKKQRIICLYNSIEFLVTEESGHKLSEELSIYDEYEHVMTCIKKVVEDIKNEEFRKRIVGAINSTFSGNSSVKSKLETLIKKIGLKLTEKDWVLFDKLKNNRQKLIHNKKLQNEITNQELDELYHLISKIIINTIFFMTNTDII